MNKQNTHEPLPDLSPESISRIENAVFAQITDSRTPSSSTVSRARLRRRRWFTGLGVAAAFAAGILVAPPILGIVSSGGGPMSASDSAAYSSGGSAEVAPVDVGSTSAVEMAPGGAVEREIIQNAQATVQVVDIRGAADEIAALAEEHDGYVESTNIRTTPVEDTTSAQAPPDSGYGSISIRVPSADLPDVIKALSSSGKVLASSVSKQDVTASAIDLRARVESSRASVERLTELMSNTATVSELIEAETALAERQAELESYEQQLAALDDQVAMSSLYVDLTRSATPTAADPAGFGDGLLAGWNGLIVSLNALVIAFGFLLPWLAVASAVLVIIWLIRRRRHPKQTIPDDSIQ